MTFEVREGNTTARLVWTNSVRNAFRKQAGWAKLQETRAIAAKHWTARLWYPTLAAVIEGRDRGVKEWKFQV
jgi:hypothetical protein